MSKKKPIRFDITDYGKLEFRKSLGILLLTRVSTLKQFEGGGGLPSQEAHALEVWGGQGYKILNVKEEKGVSGFRGKSGIRPQIDELIEECRNNPNIAIAAFDDPSRLARNFRAGSEVIDRLAKMGVEPRFTIHPNVSIRSHEGYEQIARELHEAEAFSRRQGARNQRATKDSKALGRWPWRPLPGYISTKAAPGTPKPNVEPAPEGDEQHVNRVLLTEAFQRVFDGEGPASVLHDLVERGLRTKDGKLPDVQTLTRWLRNPFYVGFGQTKSGDRYKGNWQPLVSQVVWDGVQDALSGKKPASGTHKAIDPRLVLRKQVLCDKCGRPLTGCVVTKKSGKEYPYLYCYTQGCRAVKVPAKRLERELLGLLSDFKWLPFDDLPKQVKAKWESLEVERQAQIVRLRKAIAEEQALLDALTEKWAIGKLPEEQYKRICAPHNARLSELQFDLNREQQSPASFDDAYYNGVSFAEMNSLPEAWAKADAETKQKIYAGLFQYKLRCDPEGRLHGVLLNGSLFYDSVQLWRELDEFQDRSKPILYWYEKKLEAQYGQPVDLEAWAADVRLGDGEDPAEELDTEFELDPASQGQNPSIQFKPASALIAKGLKQSGSEQFVLASPAGFEPALPP